VVNREGGILLDETVSPLTELAHQGLAPPLSHVAMSIVSPSFSLKATNKTEIQSDFNQSETATERERERFDGHTVDVESVNNFMADHDAQIAVCHISWN
jgi:hypothetical protein